jgi:hypothetical protein
MVDGGDALSTISLLHIKDHGESGLSRFHHEYAIMGGMDLPTNALECAFYGDFGVWELGLGFRVWIVKRDIRFL